MSKFKHSKLRNCIFHSIQRHKLIQEKSMEEFLYHIATGVTPPGLYGYQTELLEKRKCTFKVGKPIKIVSLENRYPKRVLKKLKKELELTGVENQHETLPLDEFFKRMSIGDFDFALFSFGLSESSRKNFNMFYKKNSIFPLSNYLVEENYSDLEQIKSRLLIGQKISKLQEDANKSARIIPLLFEKSISLLKTCLQNMTKTNNSSSQLEGFKISKRADCEN